MSNRSGSPYSAPRDANHVPLLIAASTVDGVTPVVLEADPTTHQLQVSSSGGGGGSDVQYTDGAATVAHPVGTIPVFNKAGTITAVSDTNPLPVNASVTVTGGATATNQTSGSQKTQIVDGSGNVIGATSNALNTNITNASLPVTGTFFQTTQPVSATSLPLPTGAATSANQSTEISSLATIATNTVQIPSVTSTNNSSSTTLLANAVFTGTSDDCINYSEIRVTVFSNVASATDGLSIQQSSDNSNWDIIDIYTVAAGTGKTFVIPRQARYMRVVYTNGGTNQTSFRLQTILNRTGTAPSSQRPGDAYTNETDLVQGQSFLMGYNGTTWDRVRTTGTGLLSTSTVLTAGSAAIGSITNTSFAVTQATAASLNATVVGTGTFSVQTSAQVPGTGATNLGKAEDAAHTSGDTGVFVLGVRNDGAATSFTSANGDYNPIGTDTQGRVYVVQKAPTATLSNISTSTTNATLLSSNTARVGAQIYNDSTATLYVKFGVTASSTSFTVPLATNTYYEVPAGYTGQIDGVLASGTGTARVTEET